MNSKVRPETAAGSRASFLGSDVTSIDIEVSIGGDVRGSDLALTFQTSRPRATEISVFLCHLIP